ncbi:MAG: alpha-mannosidase [Rhodobacteraceae bacterium]|nr:hypothetical protein [Alphaproteobacteria bacterium]MBT8474113.1 hypothetical protein [Alphaproteobacteria bacterium]NNK68327.1 alpha-mannosidase [Paracoccaceae bacterium]
MEGHRGALTSQGWIKRANRKAEMALHEAEALAAMAGQHPDLTHAWELVCLNQFHDVLTGTAIPEVFEDARKDYAQVEDLTEAAAGAAAAALAGDAPVVLNTMPLPATRFVTVEGDTDLPGQAVEGGTLLRLPDLAPYSVTPLVPDAVAAPGDAVTAAQQGDTWTLENALLRVVVGPNGQLQEVTDKARGRAVLAPGATANILQVFEDRPVSWDAWDIDPFFEDRCDHIDAPAKLTLVESGPLRLCLRVKTRYRDSTVTQDIILRDGSRRIDFETVVDWQESHLLLKAAFPVDILSPMATYDIQWGQIERPTHRNTTWDLARFEVPGQMWADLSEGDYGVALLNDCKYGYDIHENVLRLSLIKCATMPDPQADKGVHRFTYSLLPHPGGLAAEVQAEAMDLNYPLRVQAPGKGGARAVQVTSTAPNVIIETLKPAEDGRGLIVRFYERARQRGPVALNFNIDVECVERCDLLEVAQETLKTDGARVTIDLNPFEIVSLRIVPK